MDRVLVIESKTSNLRRVEDFLEEFSKESGISEESHAKILVSVMEAVNNAILHGNREDQNKSVEIRFVDGASWLEVSITDEGEGFQPGDIPDPTMPENIENASGRGVFLMKKLADKVVFNASGNSVRMTFNLLNG